MHVTTCRHASAIGLLLSRGQDLAVLPPCKGRYIRSLKSNGFFRPPGKVEVSQELEPAGLLHVMPSDLKQASKNEDAVSLKRPTVLQPRNLPRFPAPAAGRRHDPSSLSAKPARRTKSSLAVAACKPGVCKTLQTLLDAEKSSNSGLMDKCNISNCE